MASILDLLVQFRVVSRCCRWLGHSAPLRVQNRKTVITELLYDTLVNAVKLIDE
ncbi:MAG: hypothetical protein WEH44_00180 [Pirellulaceae bacterium]